jgi:phosphoribosylformimino-5-aminoimidazole carboxamide ribotide isomerase
MTSEDVSFVIPAVDVLGNGAVRLEHGDFRRVVAREDDPEALARRFVDAGARLVHVVDLDGARSGRTRPELVGRLVAAAAPAAVQASGGIRSLSDAEGLLDAGAARVVVGTAAFAEPDAVARYATSLGDRLVVALDVRDGRVAAAGWTRDTGLAVEEAAERCAAAGVARLLCTAIDRDGTLAGPDLDLLERVRLRSGLPVLAAGGIASPADIEAVASLGCEGAIVGRALLDGSLPLSSLAPGHNLRP